MVQLTHRQEPGNPSRFQIKLTNGERESVTSVSPSASDYDMLMLARHWEHKHDIHPLVAVRVLGIAKRIRDRHRRRVRILRSAGLIN